MLTEQRIKELADRLQYIYFVGFGFWPDVESFALGKETRPDLCVKDVLSAEILPTLVENMRPLAPSNAELIYFMITFTPGKERITEEEALWILQHMPHSY